MHSSGRRTLVLVVLPLAAASATLLGQVTTVTRPAAPGTWLPDRVGAVNDFANVISGPAAARMERTAEDVRTRFEGDLLVVTISGLPPGVESLIDAREHLVERWQLGPPSADPRSGGHILTRRSAFVVLILTQPFAAETHSAGPSNTAYDFSNEPRDLDLPSASRFARVGDFSTAAEVLVIRGAALFARDLRLRFDVPLNADSLRQLEERVWDEWVQSNRRALGEQYGAFEVTSLRALVPSPLALKGTRIAVCVTFAGMKDSTTARMSGAVFTGVPPTRYVRTAYPRQLVIAKVLGQRDGVPLLQYIASRDRCEYYLPRMAARP